MKIAEAKRLADLIADELFKDGFGKTARRLVMIMEEDGRGGPGWSKGPMSDRIAMILQLQSK